MNETMNFPIFMVMWRYGILLGWWVSDLDATLVSPAALLQTSQRGSAEHLGIVKDFLGIKNSFTKLGSGFKVWSTSVEY